MKYKIILFLTSLMLLGGCAAAGTEKPQTTKPQVGTTQSVSDIINSKIQEETSGVNEKETETEETTDDVNSIGITAEDNELPTYDSIDIDLISLTADLRYAQVYDMCANPDNYVGKIVRVQGLYSYWKNEEMNTEYKTVIITDALACCAQGMEFKEIPGQKLPNSYEGQEDTSDCEITVTGVFGYYLEDGFPYIELRDAVVE